MKWREYLQKQRGEKEKKKKKMKRGSDGETCEPESERGRKRREGGREGSISLGGKLVALWGFLLEFSLSAAGEGRRGRRGWREGRVGNSLGQQQYGICVD